MGKPSANTAYLVLDVLDDVASARGVGPFDGLESRLVPSSSGSPAVRRHIGVNPWDAQVDPDGTEYVGWLPLQWFRTRGAAFDASVFCYGEEPGRAPYGAQAAHRIAWAPGLPGVWHVFIYQAQPRMALISADRDPLEVPIEIRSAFGRPYAGIGGCWLPPGVV